MKFNIVAIDETCFLSDDAKKECGKYYGIYLYNPEEHVYCCEITPSYHMVSVGFETEKSLLLDDGETLSPLWDNLNDCLYDASHYRHCGNIDSIPEKFNKFFGEYDTVDDATEDYHANPVFFNVG